MSSPIHLYHHGDRLRASLTRELVRAGLAVETFASPAALLDAARATRPSAILWDADASSPAAAREVGAPMVLLTRARDFDGAQPGDYTVVLPFERWRVAPVTAALVGAPVSRTTRSRRDRPGRRPHQPDTIREESPPPWLDDHLDELDTLSASHPSQLTPPPTAERVRVLIADDDDVLQHILAYQLAEAGWEVTRVEDGVAAQVALERGAFDLVLIDLSLPHVNGFELLELLDLRRSGRGEQVVVMSEQAQDKKIIRAFGLGAHDFMQKPLNPRVALSRFRRLLERA